MLNYFAQGFMLGIAYVAPIGMQNLYVINTALTQNRIRAYQVALITIFFDISLALACFFGMGALMEEIHLLKIGVLFFGSIAVVYIGIQLIRSIPETNTIIDVDKSLIQIIIACFLVTWANPQALIDGSLLLGGFRASLIPQASKIFIIGVSIASMSWFLGLTTFVVFFKHNFNAKIIRGINIICGGIIIFYGLKLGYSFFQIVV